MNVCFPNTMTGRDTKSITNNSCGLTSVMIDPSYEIHLTLDDFIIITMTRNFIILDRTGKSAPNKLQMINSG